MAIPRLGARLFAVSDVHSDHGDNGSWVTAVHPTRFQSDALIVAGDVANDPATVEQTLRSLKSKFHTVFFVAGNHDLWTKHGPKDAGPGVSSMDRLVQLDAACARCGVETGPACVAGQVWVCPLLSWYDRTTHPGSPPPGYNPEHLKGWMDFYNCSWDGLVGPATPGVDGLLDQAGRVSAEMLSRNEDRLARLSALRSSSPGLPVVTFSHFVPRADLMPSVERLRFKELVDVAMCDGLDAQVRSAGASVHVFGHTHIPTNRVVDGVRYVQQPLGYPGEEWIWNRDIGAMRIWPPP